MKNSGNHIYPWWIRLAFPRISEADVFLFFYLIFFISCFHLWATITVNPNSILNEVQFFFQITTSSVYNFASNVLIVCLITLLVFSIIKINLKIVFTQKKLTDKQKDIISTFYYLLSAVAYSLFLAVSLARLAGSGIIYLITTGIISLQLIRHFFTLIIIRILGKNQSHLYYNQLSNQQMKQLEIGIILVGAPLIYFSSRLTYDSFTAFIYAHLYISLGLNIFRLMTQP